MKDDVSSSKVEDKMRCKSRILAGQEEDGRGIQIEIQGANDDKPTPKRKEKK